MSGNSPQNSNSNVSSNNLLIPHPVQQQVPTTSTDLLADFRKILQLFDRENQIYKAQISILKDTLSTLQTNEDNMISKMSQELQELRRVIDSIGTETHNSITSPITSPITPVETDPGPSRQLSDYMCQICLDAPRDCLLEPCMHFSLCARCVMQLPEAKCPICRRTIDFYQNVFIS